MAHRPRQRPSTKLSELRALKGWSVSELARRAKVSPRTVARAEEGSVPYPRTQLRIARALGGGLTPLDIWPFEEEDAPLRAVA
jgi:transcriptional regulator with XRE-family HTH domain